MLRSDAPGRNVLLYEFVFAFGSKSLRAFRIAAASMTISRIAVLFRLLVCSRLVSYNVRLIFS